METTSQASFQCKLFNTLNSFSITNYFNGKLIFLTLFLAEPLTACRHEDFVLCPVVQLCSSGSKRTFSYHCVFSKTIVATVITVVIKKNVVVSSTKGSKRKSVSN